MDEDLTYLEIQDLVNEQNYLLDQLNSNCEQPDWVREEILFKIQNLQDQIDMLI